MERAGDGAGSFTLTAVTSNSTPANRIEIVSGQTVTQAVGLGEIATFTINGTAGEDLLLALGNNTGAAFDTEIDVFAPDGSFVTRAQANGGGDEIFADITQTGQYLIVVRESAGDGAGSFTFTAVTSGSTPAVDHTPLSAGRTVAGTIEPGDIDTFSFNATAGNPFTVGLENLTGPAFDTEIDVFSPDGSFVSRSQDNGNPQDGAHGESGPDRQLPHRAEGKCGGRQRRLPPRRDPLLNMLTPTNARSLLPVEPNSMLKITTTKTPKLASFAIAAAALASPAYALSVDVTDDAAALAAGLSLDGVTIVGTPTLTAPAGGRRRLQRGHR